MLEPVSQRVSSGEEGSRDEWGGPPATATLPVGIRASARSVLLRAAQHRLLGPFPGEEAVLEPRVGVEGTTISLVTNGFHNTCSFLNLVLQISADNKYCDCLHAQVLYAPFLHKV